MVAAVNQALQLSQQLSTAALDGELLLENSMLNKQQKDSTSNLRELTSVNDCSLDFDITLSLV